MGRHSRKGRAKAGDPPAQAARRGDAAPAYGVAQGEVAASGSQPPRYSAGARHFSPHRPDAPYTPYGPDRRAEGAEAGLRRGAEYGPVRGGHPEQREPGGGWGAPPGDPGHGPARAAGRVLQGTPGTAAGAGHTTAGPRQDYLDAFDEAFFGGAPGAVRAPTPRNPGVAPGADATDPQARAEAAGQWHGPGGAGPPRRPGVPQGREPEAPEHRDAGPGDGPPAPGGDAGGAALPRPRRGGRARTVTGVVAAAVTTVLAVVVAGQVAGGDASQGTAVDGGESGRGQAANDGTASRSEDGRGAPGPPPKAKLSYGEKMAKVLPLDAGFKGRGTFAAVPGGERGAKGGAVLKYRVDVEKGLPLDEDLFTRAVHKTLNDKRSWAHGGERSFERVPGRDADFVITLASAPTTDVWCAKSGLDTSQEKVSCDSASTDRIMINAYRWARGAKTFGDDRMHSYRQMLINHEVGHRIGYNHVGCARDGAPAPVMMQQTKTVTTHGAKCRPNAWPYPRG